MIDQNTFINTYIDIIVNSLTEQIKANLQLQTQVKVNEFVVADKDRTIASLTEQLNENKIAEDWKTKYDAAEQNYSNILSKLSHMDNLLNQVGEMKRIIIAKDEEISNLQSEIAKLKNPTKPEPKVINTKANKKVEGPVKEKATITDDF